MASIIKTDNIQKVSDDSNIIKKCGSTTTVGSGSGQSIVVDGATVTLGRCGGTVSLHQVQLNQDLEEQGQLIGVLRQRQVLSQQLVGWFFCKYNSGAITVTLPASPSAGDIVAFTDYANTWAY